MSGKQDIYLADMDPNNRIISTLDIRRHIMFQLLFWDSIVLSDSQFLTDPRINILMQGFDDDEYLLNTFGFKGVAEYQKGFEKLIETGLIKIAFRQKDNMSFDAVSLWKEMSGRPGKKVPFLPESENYSRYLDSIDPHKISRKYYNLDNMEVRFKNNLLTGIYQKDFQLNPADDIDRELLHMMNERVVWFSTILDFIKLQKQKGTLSAHRYNEIYDYVFSCYSINISAETDCFIKAEINNIPLHIESGIGDYLENISKTDIKKLRPTWALNPAILDYITFDDFIKLRKRISRIITKGDITKYYTGTLSETNWKEFCDVWEAYTETLEDTLELSLNHSMYLLQNRLLEEYVPNWKKMISHPEQATIIYPSLEIVKSTVSFVPVIGDLLSIGDIVKSLATSVTCISNRKESIEILKRYRQMNEMINSHTKIITKYQ